MAKYNEIQSLYTKYSKEKKLDWNWILNYLYNV